jgi:antitoxin component YwqK of YwqJK toxin-antitoxin module
MPGTPNADKLVFKDDKGVVLQEVSMRDGLLEGETTVYTHGRVTARLMFHEGQQHGESVFMDEAGRVMVRAKYAKGLLDGESQYYNQEAQLVRKCVYREGKLEGWTIDYYPGGKVREISHYRDGLLDGRVIRYDANGNETERTCYGAGRPRPCSKEELHGGAAQTAGR